MLYSSGWIALVATFLVVVHSQYTGNISPDRDYYTLYVPGNEISAAKHLSQKLSLRFEGQVGEIPKYYMVSTPKTALKIREGDSVVKAFEKLSSLKKRNEALWSGVQSIEKQVAKKRAKRGLIYTPKEIFLSAQESLNIQDPLFGEQWHLVNQLIPGNDINVTGVWKQGITGKGVKVAFLDDGLDYSNADLAQNYYAEGSFDFNNHRSSPKPLEENESHGTRCAGQVGAGKNNACGIGIAYESKIAGIRILSGKLTDADEALALTFKNQDNDIFSCSWGPPDNGKALDKPPEIVQEAFIQGVENGRKGKGSIFVFATGNGAQYGDNCNFDGYTNSIYTISVGAIDYMNNHPSYSEACAAQLVVTYSSGGGQRITTTDTGEGKCTNLHGGTSAAAPNAAGIFALVLSVRPDLSWRDLQYICVKTAIPIRTEDSDWRRLPSGRLYNHKFGYGKLDAYAMVEEAKNHQLVNRQTRVEFLSPSGKHSIPDSSHLGFKKALKSTIRVNEDAVRLAGLVRLEHVAVTVNIKHQRRGDLIINLESPNRVVSELATERPLDLSRKGFSDWTFMSVKHWEEDPLGDWSLIVYDVSNPEATGHLVNWTLTLYGDESPATKNRSTNTAIEVRQDQETQVVAHPFIPKPTFVESAPSRPTLIKPDSKYYSTSFNTTQPEAEKNVISEYYVAFYISFGLFIFFSLLTASYYYYRYKSPRPKFSLIEPLPSRKTKVETRNLIAQL